MVYMMALQLNTTNLVIEHYILICIGKTRKRDFHGVSKLLYDKWPYLIPKGHSAVFLVTTSTKQVVLKKGKANKNL